ncbi:S8 family peptidase [Mucilaginibacter sp.]|uniref:S8 family peptidase n=1 Tax=Mucilaginibacter sp. TaxID=1882438 RepID=UPI00261DC807|nr:S8 family peptidase [Mucilaginibacter sp.]MDB4923151.1 hypothetical protein [Mucilaginibacter sp.]
MTKKSICLVMLVFCFNFCRAQITRAEKSIFEVYAAKQGGLLKQRDTLHYYLVKFDKPVFAEMKNLHLLKRISYNYYIVLSTKDIYPDRNIISATPANALWKATDDLAQAGRNHPNRMKSINLVLKHPNEALINNIKKLAIVTRRNGNILTVKIQVKNLNELLQYNQVVFASPIRKAHEELVINDIDLGANNISSINDNYPGINGNGINVSIKEESYDETDIDLLGRSFESAPKSSNNSTHATIMATLIGGNGNSFINGLGVAPSVKFTSSNFARLLPDSILFFTNNQVSVQNHSYGTGIENYYGIEAEAYDKQVFENDSLMHVFSSGNIGTTTPTTGLYNGIANSANLSGTFKQAKNVLVIGGTNRAGIVEDLSSAGPAYDGRVKPELVADGEDGTSGAAALTSGTVVLMQQAYKKKYNKLPSAALIKCVLINSADDIGLPAVDHKTGYGKLNALEALRTISDSRFYTGTVNNQQVAKFQISVPSNCSQFKVSLAWNDPPAALNAPSALINDLDLYISTPGNKTILPWTLSSFPNADSLLKPAIRQRDTLNNTEQVSIQSPSPGIYTIYVTGRRVTIGPQVFYVAYQSKLVNQFEWMLPTGNKVFAADDNYLRWQSSYNTLTGKLSVSYDHGTNWKQITNVNMADGYYKWTAPDVFTSAMLKMDINGQGYISKEFVISKPLTLNVGYNCTDGTLLHWNLQPGATGYVIYTIKDNLLQQLTTVTDTAVIIPASMQSSKYFAVSALGNNFEGIKGRTIDATLQGVGCYVKALLANVTDVNNITLTLSLGSVLNLKTITWEKRIAADVYTAIGTTEIIQNNLIYDFIDTNPQKGLNFYRAKLIAFNDKVIYSDPASAVFLQSNQFTLYPNPVSNQLNILSGELKNYELKLYDVTGRLSLKTTFNGLQNVIPISLTPGVYLFTIDFNGKILYNGKIIKI